MEETKNQKNSQQAKQPTQWTHFISIPLNKVSVVEQYEKIKSEVTSKNPELEQFFLGSSKAHITLNMLNLNEQQTIKMQEIWPLLEKKLPKLNLNLQGWGFFGKQQQKSKYLFFNVGKGLEQIEQLVEHGILNPNKEILHNIKIIEDAEGKTQFYKLVTVHATYMKSRTKDTFNGKIVMDKFPKYQIPNVEVDSIHCSIIQNQNPDEYYKSLCTINLI